MRAQRDLAPSAKIIVQTVYNPYISFSTVVVGEIVFSDFVGEQVERLNQTIRSFSDPIKQIYICDVYSYFNERQDLTLLNASPAPLVVDPHPTRRGHQAIGDAVWTVYLEAGIALPDGNGAFLKDVSVDSPTGDNTQEPPSQNSQSEQNGEQNSEPNEEPQKDESTKNINEQERFWLISGALAGSLILLVLLWLFACKFKNGKK